jgi:hypothetical protein
MNLFFYDNVQYENLEFTEEGLMYTIEVRPIVLKKNKNIDWKISKRL